MAWVSIYIEAWLNVQHVLSITIDACHAFTQNWWWSTTFLLPLVLWLWESTWKSVTYGQGNARPAIETGLAACSFGFLFYVGVIRGHLLNATIMWVTVKGPVLRLCIARYIYRGVNEPARSAAGRTFHLWVIIFLAFLAEWNSQTISGISSARLDERLRDAQHVGLITDTSRFVPLFIMLMLFDLVDVMVNAYVQWVIPWIYRRVTDGLTQRRADLVDLTHAMWCFSGMRWAWLLVRVLAFGLLTLASQQVSHGMVAYIVFGLVTAGQLSMWWDMRLMSPHAVRKDWLKRTAKRIQLIGRRPDDARRFIDTRQFTTRQEGRHFTRQQHIKKHD